MNIDIELKLTGISGYPYHLKASYASSGLNEWNLRRLTVDGVTHPVFPADLFVDEAKQIFDEAVADKIRKAEFHEPYEEVR